MARTNKADWMKLRNEFVPNTVKKMLREEGRLKLDFESAQDPMVRVRILGALLHIRKQIASFLCWPTPPKMTGVRAPHLVAPPPTAAELGRRQRSLNHTDLPGLKMARIGAPPAVPSVIDVEPAPPMPSHLPPLPPPPPPIRPEGLL